MSSSKTAGTDENLDLQGENPEGQDNTSLSDSTSHIDGEADQANPGGEDDSEEPVDTSKQPNIMFVGREEVTTIVNGERQTESVPRQPPTHIQNGMTKINLPKRDIQFAGPFFHKDADTIVNLFPSLYKHYK